MAGATRRRVTLSLIVGLLAVTAGCTGGAQLGGGDGGGADSGGQQPQPGELEATRAGEPDGSEGGGGAGSGPSQIRQRTIIMTGHVDLEVDDFDAAQRNLTATVERYGGFVSDSRVEVSRIDNATYRTGRLVLRVPRGNFSATMARAQAVGEVQSVSKDSEDVTDRLVDLDARLENLRAERDRLRQLYRNASDTEDVLAVEERLSDVQGEIERIEAEKKSLQRRVALSTIRVELHEPRPDPGTLDTERWFDTPVVAAFLESVDGVLTSLRALVVAGAYALPYAFVYGPLVVVAGYGLHRWRRTDPSIRDSSPDGDDGSDGASDGSAGERDGSEE